MSAFALSRRAVYRSPRPQESSSATHCLFGPRRRTHQLEIRHLAGHSKWSNIRHKKGANDVARAKEHSRVARAIEVASRNCKGDLSDVHLQSTISAARAAQLPKERMEKAIERGANPHMKSEGEDYVVRRYDGMLPIGNSGKVAVMVETLTENKNRTAANVRHMVTKIGGELLPTGANEWLFEHVGLVWVSKYMNNYDASVNDGNVDPKRKGADVDMDALLECALESGASDVEFGLEAIDDCNDSDLESYSDSCALIKCEPNDMTQIVQALQKDGYSPTRFEKQWLVRDEGNRTLLDSVSAEVFEKFLNSMNDDVDVTNVYHNAAFSEDD
jgi:YebC/PmpR family DNA-binding regulatory protein